jgi:hypothetical protein
MQEWYYINYDQGGNPGRSFKKNVRPGYNFAVKTVTDTIEKILAEEGITMGQSECCCTFVSNGDVFIP